MSAPRVTVLYIAGFGRSGSTVLESVLGAAPGLVSVGELRFLWGRHVRDDRVCGCGQAFSHCPFWRAVMHRAYGASSPDPAQVLSWQDRALPLRLTPLVGASRVRRRVSAQYAGYLDVLRRLYLSVAEVSGADVLVDSSKYPSYGFLLGLIDSIDVVMLHLVRDPRAVAHSWTRPKRETTVPGVSAPMSTVLPARTALDWSLWSGLAEVYGRVAHPPARRLRYEDFVTGPAHAVSTVLGQLGRPADVDGFLAGNRVRVAAGHPLGGNPSRQRAGTVCLRVDDGWRTRMRARDRWAVTALALPWMLRYGYPVGER